MARHRRISNWHVPLEQVINTWAVSPFEYGVHDCCTFANHCVHALIGIDLMKGHRDYKSQTDALKKMHKAGGLEPIVEAACREHHLSEVGPSYAQRGDLCLMNHVAGHNCGVLWLNGQVVCAGEDGGILFLPAEAIYRSWRVA